MVTAVTVTVLTCKRRAKERGYLSFEIPLFVLEIIHFYTAAAEIQL